MIVTLRPLVLRDTNKQCLLISGFCRVFYQNLLIPLRMQHSENSHNRRSSTELRMKQEIGLEGRRKSEDLKPAYMLHWPTCFSGSLGLWVPKGCFLELGALIKQ